MAGQALPHFFLEIVPHALAYISTKPTAGLCQLFHFCDNFFTGTFISIKVYGIVIKFYRDAFEGRVIARYPGLAFFIKIPFHNTI